MIARIYSPAKTSMQSGVGNTGFWLLEYEPEKPLLLAAPSGSRCSSDMLSQVRLRFSTKQEAVAFATRNAIAYHIEEPHSTTVKRLSYSDNFRCNRTEPWTH